MPQRIHEDHEMFRDVVRGKLNKALQKYITTGNLFRLRGKNGKIAIPIPQINLPHFVRGAGNDGIGRGDGKPGDVVGREKGKNGKGKGKGKGGLDPSEGMMVGVDLEFILKILKEELELPNLRAKPNKLFEETEIKYNGIAKIGPMSLLHRRKTMTQALKRSCATGDFYKLRQIPGSNIMQSVISPIKDDFRYRQWNEIKIPSSNAVLFFARDGSGSMDEEKTGIVSDISWWLECYISNYYKKVKREYVWHDTLAKTVDEKTFYGLRYGGGTICSKAMEHIADQLKHRYPPDKWNVYVFYFTDGENSYNDNEKFCKVIQDKLGPNVINLFGLVQILSYTQEGSLKYDFDKHLGSMFDKDVYRTSEISDKAGNAPANPWSWGWYRGNMSEEDRNLAIKGVLKDLLGKGRVPKAEVAA